MHGVCLCVPNMMNSELATLGRYLLLISRNYQKMSQRQFEMTAACPSFTALFIPHLCTFCPPCSVNAFLLKHQIYPTSLTLWGKLPPFGSPGWYPWISSQQLLLCCFFHSPRSPPCPGILLVPLLSILFGVTSFILELHTHPCRQTSGKPAFLAPLLAAEPPTSLPQLWLTARMKTQNCNQRPEWPLSTET